jgi:hypothetical protein
MGAPLYNIIKFIMINAIIKGLPLWYMIVRGHIITRTSIIATGLMIVLYYTWLLMNNMNLYKIYELVGDGYIDGTNTSRKTFFSYWYDLAYDKMMKRR